MNCAEPGSDRSPRSLGDTLTYQWGTAGKPTKSTLSQSRKPDKSAKSPRSRRHLSDQSIRNYPAQRVVRRCTGKRGNSGSPHSIGVRRPATCYGIAASSLTSALILSSETLRRASRPQPVGVQSFRELATTGRSSLSDGPDPIAHGPLVFPSRERSGDQERQARSRIFHRATAM
jgi:hypothetical protein